MNIADRRITRRGLVVALLAAVAVCGYGSAAHAQPPPGPPPAPPAGQGYPTAGPPAGYGYPPPYAPAPVPQSWPAPAPTPAPAPAKPTQPLVIYGWDPDVTPPAGYELDSDANMGLVGGGIALVATGWTLSVLVGIAGATAEENDEEEHPPIGDDDLSPSDWSPMYIPLVGPFLAIKTLDAEGWGLGLLLADGLMQALGTVGIVLGAVDRDYKLVPVPGALEVAPVVQRDFQGMVLRGKL